eukprot:TRINITY_DN541_c0_g1_i1.p1 TRINITY_DN541_c0_g1~~TRINITY_DN541_c0_g1_i1.p1  ORF type:complete len:391 (+),score=119.93 TRINITY_DN541_c0_g1_i1:86-1258(+)
MCIRDSINAEYGSPERSEMAVWRTLAVCVVAVAVLLALKPEVVLHLPNGFIPYAMLGHPPPAFFHYDHFAPADFRTWVRDGDVFMSAGAKCGTNWMLYTMHLIRVKGNQSKHPFEDVMYQTPWPGLKHKPTQQWSELKHMMNHTVLHDGRKLKDLWDHPEYPFRIFKAHEAPDDLQDQDGLKLSTLEGARLPVRSFPNVKFIAVMRNPEDVLRSMYTFFGNQKHQWRRLWGDFPPVYTEKSQVLTDFLEGGVLEHLVFGYMRGWWQYREDPNVLIMLYENILKQPEEHVRKIAKFVEVELTDREVKQILHLTNIKQMKHPDVSKKFDYILWGHPEQEHGTGVLMESGTLIRKGKAGEGKTFFSPEQRARIRKQTDLWISKEQQEWMGIAK